MPISLQGGAEAGLRLSYCDGVSLDEVAGSELYINTINLSAQSANQSR